MFIRWNIQVEKLEKDREKLLQEFKDIDMKKRDEIARKCNATKDLKEKVLLLNKLIPYEKKLKDYFKKNETLDKKSKSIDKIYESIDKARNKKD